MSLTDRDRKIVLFLAPILVLVGFWFLLLAPKREEAARAGDDLAKQQQRHDRAQALVSQGTQAQRSFAADYAAVVRLGKAVPTTVDMPSLLVQLDAAAKGTGIEFGKVAVGPRASAASTTGGGATAGASRAAGAPATPAGTAGGAPAQSGPGQAGQAAGASVTAANGKSAAAASAGGSAAGGAASSGAAGSGGSGAASGSASTGAGSAAGATGGSSGVAGLDSVPLQLTFKGRFFHLADFFHRIKRFVRVANDQLLVTGRLIEVDGVTFDTSSGLKAEMRATVYLAPSAEGLTAGASPAGPSAASSAPPAQTAAAAPGARLTAPASSPPAATVTR